jgi:hypothetical protein
MSVYLAASNDMNCRCLLNTGSCREGIIKDITATQISDFFITQDASPSVAFSVRNARGGQS